MTFTLYNRPSTALGMTGGYSRDVMYKIELIFTKTL